MAPVVRRIEVLRTIEESRPLTPAETTELNRLDRELAALQRQLDACRSRPEPALAWSILSPFGIQKDVSGTTWHAGHVTDVLELQDGVLLVGAQTGGIWRVTTNGDGIPLSDDWQNADVTCLALGPDGSRGAPHIVVGTAGFSRKAVLWVNDPEASDPLTTWIQVFVPEAVGSVNRMVVLPAERHIVMAGQGGLWWADIPALGHVRSVPRPYAWNQVTPSQGLPAGPCFGLAQGPNGTFVVSMPGRGLFFGGWTRQSVQMRPANLPASPPVVASLMRETSVASCASNRAVLYGVANGGGPNQDMILAVLKSTDGGQNWSVLNPRLIGDNRAFADAAGNQGSYNNCIAVSPADPLVVALGWRAGPFVAKDEGQSWRGYDANPPALHGDLHALRFSASGAKLYIGSDGGIVAAELATNDADQNFLRNFVSTYNMHLANLQFGGWPLGRGIYATFSVNPRLAGGGLQDNGNVYCSWTQEEGASEWRQIANSDGQLTLVLADGGLVFDNNSDATRATRGRWDDAAPGKVIGEGIIPLWLGGQRFDPNGLSGQRGNDFVADSVPVGSLVSGFEQAGPILAVGGVLDQVFGLFPDSRPAASQHWEWLASVGISADDFITAVASYDGQSVLVGTNGGRIFHVRRGSPAAEMRLSSESPGPVMHILVNASASPGLDGYALCSGGNGIMLHLVNGSALSSQGSWDRLGRPDDVNRIWDIAADWSAKPPVLYAALDDGVYVSRDQGGSWKAASEGLPTEPHCQSLRVQQTKLFLSTWGRSAWMATLS
jgi:hypothetical protein